MLQDIPISKKAINITGVTEGYSRAIQLALEYYRMGWVIKVRKIKGHLYLYARKYIKERRERVWKYLAPITEREVGELKKLRIINSNKCSRSQLIVPNSCSQLAFPILMSWEQWFWEPSNWEQ